MMTWTTPCCRRETDTERRERLACSIALALWTALRAFVVPRAPRDAMRGFSPDSLFFVCTVNLCGVLCRALARSLVYTGYSAVTGTATLVTPWRVRHWRTSFCLFQIARRHKTYRLKPYLPAASDSPMLNKAVRDLGLALYEAALKRIVRTTRMPCSSHTCVTA